MRAHSAKFTSGGSSLLVAQQAQDDTDTRQRDGQLRAVCRVNFITAAVVSPDQLGNGPAHANKMHS